MCSFILFSPSFEASLVNTTTGISAGLLKSSNIFSHFCPQNPVLQPTNQRSNAQNGDLLVVLHLLRRLDGGAGLRASRSQQRKSLLQARASSQDRNIFKEM